MLNFINTKAKAPAVSVFALISLVIFGLSTTIACSLLSKWYGVIIGAVLMIAAIPFHCFGKRAKWGYIVSFLLNSITNGFSLSAVYIKNGYEPKLNSMLPAIIPSAVILLFVCIILLLFKKSKKVTAISACILDVVLMIVSIVLWITKEHDVFSSFCFFSLLIVLFYLCVIGLAVGNERRHILRYVSFGSFGAFIILTLVVAFILSEGEILEGFDGFIDAGGKKNKKVTNKKQGSL